MQKKSLIALAALAAIGESAAAGWSRNGCDEPFGHQRRALNAGGLLANIDSSTLNRNVFMQAFGDGSHVDGKISLVANPSAADVLRIMRIPAGNKVSSLLISNDGLDSNAGKTLVVSLGYAPVNAADGPAANPTYFAAAGQTVLQTANDGKVYAKFDPITFDKDVYLIATIGTPSATFAAGSIWATALSIARGVK